MPMPNIQQKHLIFVYGTLKKVHGTAAHTRYLSTAKYMGGCSIPGVMIHLGGYPGLVEDKICRVTGEIYEVDTMDIHSMDAYEGVPHNYTRRLVATPHGRAWAYYKNHVPNPLPDPLVCVDRGLWQGGTGDRMPYHKLVDFYANKRWLEPEYRNMTTQPMVLDIIPQTNAELQRAMEAQLTTEEAKPTETRSSVVALPLRAVNVRVDVGPGTEMM